jgi:PTH1 family peptidyl-tRNA hydrolase
MKKEEIKLVIGLGNPDKKYDQTYHNVGHMMIDKLGKGIKSDVFMNQSGRFAKEAMKKKNLKPKNLLIIHDDSDIYLGKYKLSFGRNAAGHKGVQNIIDQLKTKDFWRLRIGVRNPKEKIRLKAEALVLKKITPANKKILEQVFQEVAEKL